MANKVLFVVTSCGEMGATGKKTGYWLSEVTHPWSVLSSAYEIDVVSPKGGKPPVDGFDLSDPINKKYWDDPAWQQKMDHTMTPDMVKPEDYLAIFYAGGHGAMWDFPGNEQLAGIAQRIYENGGLVAAVCHGPSGLLPIKDAAGAPLLKGRTVDSFTNQEERLNGTWDVVPFHLQTAILEKGADYDEAPAWSDHVVVDGRLVTGQNPMSALSLGKKLLELLSSVKLKQTR